MKPTPGRVVLSPVVTRGENRLVNMIEKKLSGFPSGLQLTAQLKARRGLLFRRGSSVLLLSVALCLVVLAPFVPFDCPTRRTCTALADAVTSLETDTGWNDSSSWTDTQQDTAVEGSADAREDGSATELDGGGTEGDGSATELDGGATDVYGGATDADGGAIDVEGGVTEGMSMTLGEATESYAIESLRAPSRSPSVAALVPRIHRSGQARPIVVSGILASVVLSIILGAIFLNSDRILITETTPSPNATPPEIADVEGVEKVFTQPVTKKKDSMRRELIVAGLATVAAGIALYLITHRKAPEPPQEGGVTEHVKNLLSNLRYEPQNNNFGIVRGDVGTVVAHYRF